MEMSMEEDESSFDSNTDAIIYGVSDPSGSDESMISGPNISSSSSDDDISHHEQQQIPAAAGTDDMTVSSSSWITNNNNNNNSSNNQIEEEAAIMIFNVDFGALSRVAVHNDLTVSSSSWITNNNYRNNQIEEEAAIMIFNVDFGALSRDEEEQSDAGMDELLAVLGYRVKSSDMAEVAQKLEQLEMAMGTTMEDGITHLSTDTIHKNPSDLSGWVQSMLSELNQSSTNFDLGNDGEKEIVVSGCGSSSTIIDFSRNEQKRTTKISDDDLRAIPGGAVFRDSSYSNKRQRSSPSHSFYTNFYI